jgi:hypothetical protein
LPDRSLRMLDAGSSLNHPTVLDHHAIAAKQLHVVTFANEEGSVRKPGVSYLFADLRFLPMNTGFYDLVVCISTVEHVGCDNRFYTGNALPDAVRVDDYLIAMREMSRVLKPGGLFLMTVPYGTYEFHGAFQQFDRKRLSLAVRAFGPTTELSERFYRYSRDGWQLSNSKDCQDCRYVGWVAEVMRTRRWPDVLRLEPDGAAAARAVACVKMVKPETPSP